MIIWDQVVRTEKLHLHLQMLDSKTFPRSSENDHVVNVVDYAYWFIDFYMLNQPYMSEMKLTWSWWIIFWICSWIHFAVFIEIFVCLFSSGKLVYNSLFFVVSLSGFSIEALLKKNWKHFFLSLFTELFWEYWC